MAQVASATVTPALLNDVVNQIKEHIALVVAEVVARCICELTLNLVNKTVSKACLPLRVASIANSTVKAVNKATFGTKTLNCDSVKEKIIKACFEDKPNSTPIPSSSKNSNPLPSTSQTQASQNAKSSSQR